MERKLLTILFVDLVDSTRLVSASDPEVVRRRVSGFFDHVRHCIEHHGGTVRTLAGDAMIAAFGLPQTHEDDAERGIRAGLAVLESVMNLGLEARVGLEAGEVVTDEDDTTFATGEAINVAVRLQEAASPGQLLIGPAAYRLTVGRLEVEDVGPVELKGIAQPVWAWHVLGVLDGQPMHALAAPLVGRESELELLENTFTRVVRDKRAHVFTIYGEPGVGKSRLAREFVVGLEGATVLSGRCLPYGEGITYWPLAEMVKVAAGITDDEPVREAMGKLRACCEDEAVADLLALASGVLEAVEAERTQHEIAWAARQWAEQLADAQPLVLVFEDIHWAEEPLLQLVESLAAAIRDAPLFLLCLARPELLEIHPAWGGGRLRATAIELEALNRDESRELIEALSASRPLSDEAQDALVDKTGGNPLFVEETIRMLAEQDGAGAPDRIPDTVQALIAARIDRLPPAEKAALQRAAVVGRDFWQGAVEHLSRDSAEVEGVLNGLLERDFLVRSSRSTITGEKAYRFKHVLIREVAYGGLPKTARAELHERFAGWLEERAGDELLEFRAHTLDQAATLHAELDGSAGPELSERAAATLEAAGRRALAREGYRTARKHLLRSAELSPTLERRWLAGRAALRLGDWPAVASELEAVRKAAAEAGELKIHGRALTGLAEVALHKHAEVGRARELSEQALDVLADVTHPDSKFDALMARAAVSSWLGEVGDYEKYLRKALEIARAADRKDLETVASENLAGNFLHQLKVAEAETLVERALEVAEESGSVFAKAHARATLGALHMTKDELEEAEEVFEQALVLYTEVGQASGIAHTLQRLGRVAQRNGDAAKAERYLRDSIRTLKPLGERGFLCESQRMLAQILAEQGKVEEAERLALEARETVGPEDAVSQLTTRLALGVVRAAQGRHEEAGQLLGSALAEIQKSPFRSAEPEALRVYAQFLRERGRDDEAEPLEARLAELSYAAPAASAAQIA